MPILQAWRLPKLEKWSQEIVEYLRPPLCSEINQRSCCVFLSIFSTKIGERSNLCLVLKSGRSGTVVKRNDPLFEDLGNSFARDYKMYPHRLTGQPPESSCTKKIDTKDRIRKNKAKQSQLLESFHWRVFNVEAYVRLALLGCNDPEEVLSTIIYTFFCSILNKELTLSKHIYCILMKCVRLATYVVDSKQFPVEKNSACKSIFIQHIWIMRKATPFVKQFWRKRVWIQELLSIYQPTDIGVKV